MARIQEIYIDGSFCTKSQIQVISMAIGSSRTKASMIALMRTGSTSNLILVPHVRKWKWRIWADHGVEFFMHPAMQASPEMGFPEFLRHGRDGQPRGIVQVVKGLQS